MLDDQFIDPARRTEEDEARAAFVPYFDMLWRQRHAALKEYRIPVCVEVPHAFPQLLDDTVILGLPVRRADVTEPRVVDESDPRWRNGVAF